MTLQRLVALLALILLAVAGGAVYLYGPGGSRFGERGERFPRWEQSRVAAAEAAWQADDRPRAVAAFRKLAARHPDSVFLHHRLGMALRASGEREAALEAFRRAHALAPEDETIRVDFVLALDAAGLRDEAIREAREAAHDPRAPSLIVAIAGALLQKAGRGEEALPLLSRAVEADPRNALAWYALGSAHAAGGDGRGAEEAFGKALSLAPCDLETLHAAATNALLTLDDRDLALRYAEQAIACPTGRAREKAEFFYLRAELQLERGDPDAALFSLSSALEAGYDRKDWCDPASTLARVLGGREEFRMLVKERCDPEVRSSP